MQIEVRDNNADEFAFPICQYFGKLVFLITQINQRLRNNILVFTVRESGLLKYLDIVVLEKLVYFAISLKVTFFYSYSPPILIEQQKRISMILIIAV